MTQMKFKEEVLKNPAKPAAPKPWEGRPRGYVNADILKHEKDDYEQWRKEQPGEELWNMVCTLVEDGHRLSLGTDARGFKASATNIDGPIGSRGLCLSGYGSGADTALLSLLYKHYIKLDKEWGTGEAEGDDYIR